MSNNVDRPPKLSRIRDPNRGSTEKFRPTGPTSSYSSAAHPEVAIYFFDTQDSRKYI